MAEEICSQGHVLNTGARLCQRCGGEAIGLQHNAPVEAEEAVVVPESLVDEAVVDEVVVDEVADEALDEVEVAEVEAEEAEEAEAEPEVELPEEALG